ncbi:piggyBac transposable element-derived protein 3-like [Hydra vulgaris]|uniref:PiggyBac transposable element-derived protein 3-like n=1 Tax=Hydra vulgaris TaxID=6087 RepID=A0ABM4BPK0_HYDVU
MDSKAVDLASNYTSPNPAGICERYSGKDKAYIKLSCPRMVIDYNKTMGGVDLFNQNTKNYSISTRLKKWYWSLWTWFLNVQMIQAWRLYRYTWRNRYLTDQEKNHHGDVEFEDILNAAGLSKFAKSRQRIIRNKCKMKKRKEEKKVYEITLLEFIRQSVKLMLMNHSDHKYSLLIPQREVSRLSTNSKQAIRYDHTRAHFVTKTEVKGVCQYCHDRSNFRCESCDVALHPGCFVNYHRPENKL